MARELDLTRCVHNEVDAWARVLGQFAGQKLLALEIGNFEGGSACWLMDNILTNQESILVCVDPYEFVVTDSDSEKEVAAFPKREELLEARARFDHNTKPYRNKIYQFVVSSDDFFKRWKHEFKFDLIIVDGSHAAVQVLKDLLHSWDWLKKNGMLLADDYGWTGDCGWESDGPKRAIDAFMAIVPAVDYKVLHKGFIVILEKLYGRSTSTIVDEVAT